MDIREIQQLWNARITRKEAEGKPFEQAVAETNAEIKSIIENMNSQNIQQNQDNVPQNNISEDVKTATSDVENVIKKMQQYSPEGGYLSKVNLAYDPAELNNYVKAISTILGNAQQGIQDQPYEGMVVQSPFGFNYRYTAPIGLLNEIMKTYNIVKENQKMQEEAKKAVETINKTVGDKFGVKNIDVGYEYKPEYAFSGSGSTAKKIDWYQDYNKTVGVVTEKDLVGTQVFGNTVGKILSPHEFKAFLEGDYNSIEPIVDAKFNYMKNLMELARGKEILTKDNIKYYFQQVLDYSNDVVPILYKYYKSKGYSDEDAKATALNKVNNGLYRVYGSITSIMPESASVLPNPKDLEIRDVGVGLKNSKDMVIAKDAYTKANNDNIWKEIEIDLADYYKQATGKGLKTPKEFIDRFGKKAYINFITKKIQEKFGDILKIENETIKDSIIDILNNKSKDKFRVIFSE